MRRNGPLALIFHTIFVILVIIGWMYSHRRETFRFFQWITRGRFRAPPEEYYTS